MPAFPSIPPALAVPGGGAVVSSLDALKNMHNGAPVAAVAPAANVGIFVPFRLPGPAVAQKMVMGGTTAGGNFDIGIYDQWGNRLVSSGSTAKPTNAELVVDIADTVLGRGLYYMAMSVDNNTSPYMRSSVTVAIARLAGILKASSVFPLPATVTFASAADTWVPMMLVQLRAL